MSRRPESRWPFWQPTVELRESDQTADVRRRGTLPTQLAQGGRPGRLRQLLARVIEHQPVVPVDRLRNTKQALQQPVDAGGPEQVLAPHHIGDALQGVV